MHAHVYFSFNVYTSGVCEFPQEQYEFVYHTVAQMFQKFTQDKNNKVRRNYSRCQKYWQ